MRRARAAAVLLAALPLLAAAPASGDASRSATRDGMTLSVSKAVGLAVDGETVTVRGTGYDRSKGIYVAFCVDNGPGRVPTPCGGGQDRDGSSGGSVWISDFPPYYGTGLARPYGDGGSFQVTLSVRAQLDEDTDCRRVRCAVVTRADHTRSDDRSADVVVPVTFGSTAAAPRPVAPRSAAPAPTLSTTAPEPVPVRTGGGAAALPESPEPSPPAATASPSAAPSTSPPAPVAEQVVPTAAAPEVEAVATAGTPDEGAPVLGLAGLAGLLAAGTAAALLRRRSRTGA